MWEILWNDFRARAAELRLRIVPQLLAGGAVEIGDAVDYTILWQLFGMQPFVPSSIAAADLQLPELYSGSPWLQDQPWIAFVTANPSIEPQEIFPTPALLRERGLEDMIAFFDQRFAPNPIHDPIIHGRNVGQAVTWLNVREGDPEYRLQPTWGAIDAAVRTIFGLDANYPAPLGQRAAIIDLVPWKFANWTALPDNTKRDLINAGQRYLQWTLNLHPPSVVIAAGKDVRVAMHELYGEGIPVYQPNVWQQGTITINGNAVPWFGVVAPAQQRNRFDLEIGHITRTLGSTRLV